MKLVCYVACLCVAGARTRGICFANALCSRCVGFGLLFAKFFMPWWHYSVELRASFWEEPYPKFWLLYAKFWVPRWRCILNYRLLFLEKAELRSGLLYVKFWDAEMGHVF